MIDPAEVFLQEAAELLEQLEQALLDLEKSPSNNGLINTAFRALHTLKGSGAMFGFERVASFVHDFETAFDQVRKGHASSSRDLIAIALMAQDHIRTLIERPNDADTSVGESILTNLREVLDSSSSRPGGEPKSGRINSDIRNGFDEGKPAASGKTTWHLQFRFDEKVLINGTNPLLLLDELRELGECGVCAITDAVPLLQDLKADVCYLSFDVILTTEQDRSTIEDVFIFVADNMELSIELVQQIAGTSSFATVPPIDSPNGEQILAETGVASQVVVTKSQQQELRQDQKPAVEAVGDQRGADTAAVGRKDTTVRVPAERVDELMDRVGELVIAQARLSQLAEKSRDLDMKAVAEEIQRLSSGLRDVTMGIRMLPISALFGRFRRLVHDLSRELGKPLELSTAGEETELDKTMIDRLADPLVHLIRNAVDHGLENPAQRAAAGKPPTGHLKLIARHSGAEVLILVSDDGQGLNTAKIRTKAEAQGLISPGQQMSDFEINQLIFHAGLSTTSEVTKFSGRGVGMDVVKRDIEAMRGAIDLFSTPGKGTEITLRLPLTLAIIEGLLIRVGAGRYIVPLSLVEECVELSAADDVRSKGRNFLNIRGELVPFMRLRELFEAKTPADLHQKVVIVSAGEQRIGLVVDQIIGNHQTVIKTLSKLHSEVTSFSGATILGDGSVALILDIPHLVDLGAKDEKNQKNKGKEAA